MGNFSDEKRKRVARQLREAGRELFGQYGLQKTTITDLTDFAGIATGTFYQFYDSKEELYVKILEEEGEKIQRHAISESFETYDDPEKAIEVYLQIIMDAIENKPIIYRMIADDELDQLIQHRGDEQMKSDRHEMAEYLVPYIQEWYDNDEIAGSSPEIVIHSIRAIRLLALHEEEIGTEHYQEVRDTIINAIARGLTCQSDKTSGGSTGHSSDIAEE